MSLSTSQPPGIFEDGGNHMKPLVAAVVIFAVAVIACLLIAGLPHTAG